MKYTEEEMLNCLKQDRETGAAMLMEEYAGLIWSVCGKHLNDEEDIKECVNSTFADFCLNSGKYDPEKGSLKNYLCRIAAHKAIDCYQANCRRRKAEEEAGEKMYGSGNVTEAVGSTGIDGKTGCAGWAGTESPGQGDALAEHLDDALDQLEPVDSQILRMKYYDGLSYQEIAKKLGLNEAAVKMRSMRSRKKLMKILIAVLIMLLLVACVAAALRHYQFSELGGVVWSDEPLMYELDDGEYSWEQDGIQFEVTEAIFLVSDEESLVGTVTLYLESTVPEDIQSLTEGETERKLLKLVGLIDNRERYSAGKYKMYWDYSQSIAVYTKSRQKYRIEMSWKLEELGQERITMPLYQGENYLMDITLVPAELRDYEMGQSSIVFMDNLEWIPGPALSGDEYTVISMSQCGESQWKISPQFTSSRYGLQGREWEPIVLLGEDGTEYEMRYGRINTYPLANTTVLEQYDLYFPSVPVGEYTMKIPYIFLQSSWTSEEFTLTLPKEENQPLECDVTALFPDGSGIHITGITKNEHVQISYDQNEGSTELVENRVYYWEYALELETFASGNPAFHMAVPESVEGPKIYPSISEGMTLSFQILQGEEPEEITLRFTNPEYVLEKEFTLDVTVQKSEE